MDLMQRRRELLGMQSDLPSAYQRVEYLESDGTQYIYTDIPGCSGVECAAKVMWTAFTSDQCIFGCRKNSSDRVMLIHQYPSYKWTFGYGSSTTGLGQIAVDTVYNVNAKAVSGDQYLKVDGVTLYTGTSESVISNNRNFAIFGSSYDPSSVVGLKSSARVYSLSVKKDGVPAANFIPCVRKSDSKPGMYDTVSKTFYTNAGTGEFIVPA